MRPPRLPVDDALPGLCDALARAGAAVLTAPPGAGKTTHVPLALLDVDWAAGRRVLVLEPRRLAAKAAAARMAWLLGQTVGGTAGYRMRHETRVSDRTRVEVITEGVLPRLLAADPSLADVAAVVFDEYHERSVEADLGLALCLEAREVLRPDLRLLIMSATLDAEPVAALLGGAPVVSATGRQFPVAVRYAPSPLREPVEDATAAAVRRVLDDVEGDVLVFLAGAREIRRVEERLAGGLHPAVRVVPLFGNLSWADQQRAIEPAAKGLRKVVLATSIAETSLTIEGVRAVVDSGFVRVPRFSPRTGLTRLETVRVTRDAAEQRRGRAGRVAPGLCVRLWTEAEHAGLVPHRRPAILDADLASLVLELAAWGVTDPARLAWIDPPPAGATAQARELLTGLGALDGSGAITAIGRRMTAIGAHPRLARMMLDADSPAAARVAGDIAALLAERDPLRGGAGAADPDIRLRLDAIAAARGGRAPAGPWARIAAESAHWLRRAGPPVDSASTGAGRADAGRLLARAYPDRIAHRRPGDRGRFLLRTGRGAAMDAAARLAGEEWIVAAAVEGGGREARIALAAPLDAATIEALFGDAVRVEREVAVEGEAVQVVERRRLGAIVLAERRRPADAAEAAAALLEHVGRHGPAILRWTPGARALRERLAFLHAADDRWPDVSDEALARDAHAWLGPALLAAGGSPARTDLHAALLGLLDWPLRRRLDELAPTHLTVPSGSTLPIDYSDPAAPALAVRLQEVFGLAETPRLAGTVPLTLRLLSPANRPVQVTRDLASFWRDAYFDVRKDLRGRYPKHAWPEDPLSAAPQRGARRRPPRG